MPIDPVRRRTLLGALSASLLTLAEISANSHAQSLESGANQQGFGPRPPNSNAGRLALPKVALVIGNGAYKAAPLRNPVNDAKAIAAVLQQTGFNVTTLIDVNREDHIRAIQNYSRLLAKEKGIGLYYFAGHGVQIAWRNYMVPVGVSVNAVKDIPTQCVELSALLDGLKQAANPVNIVILDACRDNPFGHQREVDHKGLSQVDAPNGTLLAYATAPGNVALDGEGVHGLYTEHLLREFKVPATKIEDVFKRVRLGVRLGSSGRQVPWESTSLEDDFYLIPPENSKKTTDVEIQRQFDAELAIWEKIKDSTEPGPLEDYLRRFPGGRFSELALFRLDRVLAKLGEKKIAIAPAGENPFTKGTGRVDTGYKVGDWYTYQETDLLAGAELRTFRLNVTGITDSEVHFNGGNLITDLMGNTVKLPNGQRFSGQQVYVHEYTIGKRWIAHYKIYGAQGASGEALQDLRVVAREKISVKAGAYDCYKVQARGASKILSTGTGTIFEITFWFAPECRRPVLQDFLRKRYNGVVTESYRRELIAFHQN